MKEYVVSAEIYTAGKSDGSDKSHLWAKVTNRISRFQCYQSHFRGLMVYVPLIPKLIVLTGWWLSEAEQSVIIEHIVTSRLSQSQSRRRPLPAGPQGVTPLLLATSSVTGFVPVNNWISPLQPNLISLSSWLKVVDKTESRRRSGGWRRWGWGWPSHLQPI